MYKKKMEFAGMKGIGGMRKRRSDKGRKRRGGMSTRKKVAIGAGIAAGAGAAGAGAMAMRRRGRKPGAIKALPGSSQRALPGAPPKRKALPYGR